MKKNILENIHGMSERRGMTAK